MIRFGAAPHPARRPGGGRPAGHHRRRRWRSASACCWPRWPAINAVNDPERPLRLARTAARRRAAPDPRRDPLWWLAARATTSTADADRPGRRRRRPARTRRCRPASRGCPGPGEYYASPALADLLARRARRATSATASRAGRPAPSATPRCPRPDSLIVIVGRTPDEVAALPDAVQVNRHRRPIRPTAPAACRHRRRGSTSSSAWSPAALLFPVLILIGTATRLAAARREQRFAAMRLVGATPAADLGDRRGRGDRRRGPRHRRSASACSSRSATRSPRSRSPATPFFPTTVARAARRAPGRRSASRLAAAVAARLALRRVRISPLGVTRRVTPRPPRAYRLIPLAARPRRTRLLHRPAAARRAAARSCAFLPGFLLIMAGLVFAGPWLTMAGARMMARRASRPAALIAARRLADNPKAAFRAVSGLVLALFVTTVAVGVIGTIVANRGPGRRREAEHLHHLFRDPGGGRHRGARRVPGVRGVAAVRAAPEDCRCPTGLRGRFPPCRSRRARTWPGPRASAGARRAPRWPGCRPTWQRRPRSGRRRR